MVSETTRTLNRKHLAALGHIVRDIRRSTLNETQEGLATRSGLDRGFVGAVERGERDLGLLKLREVLIALGLDWPTFGRLMQDHDALPQRGRLALRLEAERRFLARRQESEPVPECEGPTNPNGDTPA